MHCLNGREAPPLVIDGWNQFKRFSPAAREPFWLILAPVLMNPGNGANKELIALFCKEHQVPSQAVVGAIGCCELLLKQAAAMDLDIGLFKQDVLALSGDQPDDLVRFVVDRYPSAKQGLRKQIFESSLSAHGKVMTDLEWRLDKVEHSSRGSHLSTDIVMLTLHYLDGSHKERITLQLTREAAHKLRTFCKRLDEQDSA